MLNFGFFAPSPAAAPALSSSQEPAARPDASRVIVHKLPYAAGVTGEVLVVFLCLLSIYISAGKEADGAADILVIRAATATVELGRIPFAYLARKLQSAEWRSFCFASVLCMGFITAFNIFIPYNAAVRKMIAGPEMTAANIVAVEQKGARLHDEVVAKRTAHDAAENRVTTAAEAVANLPRGASGRKALQGNLADARKAEKFAETEVKTAEKNEADFGAEKQAALDKAKEAHRKEIGGNLIYGAAATLMRVDPAAIPPDMMSTAILAITIIPSLVMGFFMSGICLASVERIAPAKQEPAPELVEVPDELPLAIMTAAANKIAEAAASRVSDKLIGDMERAEKPAANDNEKSPLVVAFRKLVKKAKAKRPTKAKASRKTDAAPKGNGSVEPVATEPPKRRGRPRSAPPLEN